MTDELKITEDTPTPTTDDGTEVSFGVHAMMMVDGTFGIQATGTPNIGEMQMVLARALASVEARMVAETVLHAQAQAKSPIITPVMH